jgi:hypothetical protein
MEGGDKELMSDMGCAHLQLKKDERMAAFEETKVCDSGRSLTSSFGSLVMGLLHKSMVLAWDLVEFPHHDSHHSHC